MHESGVPTYGTPQETFDTWRAAVDRLDLETVIACYADSAKPGIRQEIQTSTKDGLEAMRNESKNTDFKVEKIIYEGSKAYLRVKRSLGPVEEIEVLSMTLENGGCKLLPQTY